MSEELNESVVNVAAEEQAAVAPVPEVPATEAVTEKSSAPPGFIPYDKWVKNGGDPDEWRSPREFNERGQLIGTVQKLKSDLDESRNAIRLLAESNKRIEEQTYKKALEELKVKHLEAARFGQEEVAAQTLDKIMELKDQQSKVQAPVFNEQTNMQAAIQQEAQAFAKRNPWFQTDSKMANFAKAEEMRLIREQPQLAYNPAALLLEVENSVKDTFAHKFTNIKRYEEPMVEKSEGKPVPSSKLKFEELSSGLKAQFNQIKKAHPTYTLADFERDIKDEGVL